MLVSAGWLRRTALVLAPLILVVMAVPKAGVAQFPPTLFYIWVLVAGMVLARRPRAVSPTSAPRTQVAGASPR